MRLKKIFLVLLINLFFLIAIFMSLPFVLEMNAFKPQIQKYIASKTNLNVDYSNMKINILNEPGVTFNKVTISKLNAQNEKKIIQANSIQLKTNFKSLFHGQTITGLNAIIEDVNSQNENKENSYLLHDLIIQCNEIKFNQENSQLSFHAVLNAKLESKNNIENLLEGLSQINVTFEGLANLKSNFLNSIAGKGNYTLSNVKINTQQLFNSTIQSFLKKENIQLNLKNFNLNSFKLKEFKTIEGPYEIQNGQLIFNNQLQNKIGTTQIHVIYMPMNHKVNGWAKFEGTTILTKKLLSIDKNLKYLIDNDNKLKLNFTIEGTIVKPIFILDESAIKKRLGKKIEDKIKETLKKNPEIDKLKNKLQNFLNKNGFKIKL